MVTRKIQPVIVAVTTKTASKTIGKEAGGKVTSKAVSKAAVKVAGKPAPEPVTVSINNAVKIAPICSKISLQPCPPLRPKKPSMICWTSLAYASNASSLMDRKARQTSGTNRTKMNGSSFC